MNKKDLIGHLETIAVYMEIKGENPFKISAYRKAAQALEYDERSLNEIEDAGSLKGIGKGTAALIKEWRDNNGETELMQTLTEEVPEGLIPLLKLPGLGGKKVSKLYQELDITDRHSLEQACLTHEVQNLEGFGAKTEQKILEALAEEGKRPERLPIAYMLEMAEKLEASLEKVKGVQRYARAGSLRRVEESVKDLDYIMSVADAENVRKQLVEMPEVTKVINDGTSKVSIEIKGEYNVQVDIRLVEEEDFASTLHHFTGSKDHNVQMRQLAKERNEKLSEYGIEDQNGNKTTFQNEAEFYDHFGLHFIPPEARLGRDETDKFRKPYSYIEKKNIRGDLHMHTTWSDGSLSIREMVEEVKKHGYEWMALTDHSKYLRIAHGLDEERIRRQIEEIRNVREEEKDIQIFAGIEMDIRPDGKLDIEDEVLEELDVVIASIHSSFSQTKEEIMKRLEQALDHPEVNIIAHPTGRLLGRRDGYKVDVDRLMKRAGETNTALELNANPNRLDLSADWLRKAAEYNVRIAINTDAHNPGMLDHMDVGISIAKKALLQPEQVINTMTAEQLKKWLKRKKQ
ncbi:DNA polymerase/3'-5' exonuclease PolX [Marinococcus luteus]|uniref:DNA polymerase/3'-5' exonuclease PolX n=1 Tax=Marinococcus luteus TaxID=1122204 RepID=UPI002ACC8E80|nr:DNA polymerase/3'-5' exonuclease PolX [Marinococcus luteus]MDZ5783759.1 DNA polymerase/3'-5' exonuclease PolX [Marinococcus luteus]